LRGTVTYQEKRVRMGSVLVLGVDGVPRAALIQDDGSYAVADVPAGPVRVAVNSPDPRAAPAISSRKKAPPPADAGKWFAIPERYADFERSRLTFTVKPGANVFDILLQNEEG
jgi:hypothetical protein